KRATLELANAAEAAHIRAGLLDPKMMRVRAEGRRPLAEHLAEWRAALEAKEDTVKHAFNYHNLAARIAALAKATSIADLTPARVQVALARYRDTGVSLQACNHAIRATKGFVRWLWRDGRIDGDAMAHLKGYNITLDRRHDRRAFTPEELALL